MRVYNIQAKMSDRSKAAVLYVFIDFSVDVFG